MNKIIGAQLYTIRKHCNTIEDFDMSMSKIKDIGYNTVQVSGIAVKDGKEIKNVLDKHNMTATVTHCPFAWLYDDIECGISYQKDLDCNIIGIGSMPGMNQITGPEIFEHTSKFTDICNTVAKHNMIFAYHNHSFEFMKYKGKYIIDHILDSVEADNFKLTFDVYWAAYSGVNPAKFIREHKDNIICLHYKDLKVQIDKDIRYAPVGDGNLDWDDIIDASLQTNAIAAYVEQDDCYEENEFDCLKRSYDFLSKKGFC